MKPPMKPPLKPRTRVNHPPRIELPPDNRALVAPIWQSVKFEFDTIAAAEETFHGQREGYFYSRTANPTTRELELLLAGLQGREDCIVTSSGIAAVSAALLTLLAAGDHVLGFVDGYGPTRQLLRRTLGRFGVRHTLLAVDDHAGIERVLAQTPTRLVWLESPTNPMLKIADVARICASAHEHGALVVLDNTFAGFHGHGDQPVDVYVHSLTKYASGHGDVMGGALIAARALTERLRHEITLLGPTLDPHAAFLLMRGLKTYHVRRAAECATALAIARFLEAQPRVRRVHYPGLPAHVGHALACAQMADFGTVVTADLDGTSEHARAFVEALELFATTASLGSTESLVLPPQFLEPRDLAPAQRELSGIRPTTVRLSIGLEDVEDLIADLTQALARAYVP